MRLVWERRTFASNLKEMSKSEEKLSKEIYRDFYTVLGWNSDKKHQVQEKKKNPKGEIYQTVEQCPAKSSESRMVLVTSFKCFTWYHIYTVNRKYFYFKNCCYICVSSTLHLEKQKTIFTFSLVLCFLLLFSYNWEHLYCFLCLFCFVFMQAANRRIGKCRVFITWNIRGGFFILQRVKIRMKLSPAI